MVACSVVGCTRKSTAIIDKLLLRRKLLLAMWRRQFLIRKGKYICSGWPNKLPNCFQERQRTSKGTFYYYDMSVHCKKSQNVIEDR
jgi:hypothetical protein